MPNNGTEVVVVRLPDCDIHKYDLNTPGVEAHYDAKTMRGPWANMCEDCYQDNAMYKVLGTGKGQRLVLKQ